MRYALALLGAISLSACAQPAETKVVDGSDATAQPSAAIAEVSTTPGTPEDRARQAILSISPNVVIDRIAKAPLPGFLEVVVGGQVLYVSDDGRYLLQGSLFDVAARADLSQDGLAEVRRTLLATVPREDRIVFAPANPKYTVSVFTDVECGYCRRLHSEIAEYNKRGIAIEYLAFPRMGLDSDDYRQMVSVWCAPDRKQALTDAKNGKHLPKRDCDNPVATQYALGQRVGLAGTPMIVTASGVQMPGYMPPAALEEMLRSLAEQAPSSDASAGSR